MYSAQNINVAKTIPAPVISTIFKILVAPGFFSLISLLWTERLIVIMTMSMRMLRMRIMKLVPSIEDRREGEGRVLGEERQRRIIIRNLATSLDQMKSRFCIFLSFRFINLVVEAVRGMKPAHRQMRASRYCGMMIVLQYLETLLLK